MVSLCPLESLLPAALVCVIRQGRDHRRVEAENLKWTRATHLIVRARDRQIHYFNNFEFIRNGLGRRSARTTIADGLFFPSRLCFLSFRASRPLSPSPMVLFHICVSCPLLSLMTLSNLHHWITYVSCTSLRFPFHCFRLSTSFFRFLVSLRVTLHPATTFWLFALLN
jgi:hypothetical protein